MLLAPLLPLKCLGAVAFHYVMLNLVIPWFSLWLSVKQNAAGKLGSWMWIWQRWPSPTSDSSAKCMLWYRQENKTAAFLHDRIMLSLSSTPQGSYCLDLQKGIDWLYFHSIAQPFPKVYITNCALLVFIYVGHSKSSR